MPIREFGCKTCGHVFEELVFSKRDEAGTACPRCGKRRLSKLLSVFGVAGTGKKVRTQAKSCGSCSSHSCSTCN
jgi:putative FmdB family regulatory protein